MTMVSKTLPGALLLTLRQVNVEAKPYLASKLVILQKSERFHFVLDTDSTRLFCSFGGRKPAMMRINLKEHEARDVAHPLRTLPETYQLHDEPLEQGTQAYVDMQSFARRYSSALLNQYPGTMLNKYP
jgi:hypothetical protein